MDLKYLILLFPDPLVAKITRNGPAYAGGIRVGDVIHEIGGKKVTNMKDLLRCQGTT